MKFPNKIIKNPITELSENPLSTDMSYHVVILEICKLLTDENNLFCFK